MAETVPMRNRLSFVASEKICMMLYFSRTKEADRLKEDLIRARTAEKQAKQKLFEVMGNHYTVTMSNM